MSAISRSLHRFVRWSRTFDFPDHGGSDARGRHAMLNYCDGNKSEAARQLSISRPRLQRLLDATSDDNADLNDEAEVDS